MTRNVRLILAATFLALAACSSPAGSVPSEIPAGIPQTTALQAGTPETNAPTATATAEAPQAVETLVQSQPASPTPNPTSAPTLPAAEAPIPFHIVPGESEVVYEVGEVFIDQDNRFNVAVGVTGQVEGEVLVDRQNPQNSSLGTITVNISQFTSDSARRDNFIRDRFLESSRYPTATFVPAEIQGLPTAYDEGEAIRLTVSGDLTVREETRPVTFDVTVDLNGEELTGEAFTTIRMSDFGFGPIDLAGILKTEDEVKVTLRFVARP